MGLVVARQPEDGCPCVTS